MKALTRAALGLLCALQLALPTAAFAQTPPIDTAFGYIPQYALVFGSRKSPGIEVTDARPLPTYCVSYLGSSCGGGGSASLSPWTPDPGSLVTITDTSAHLLGGSASTVEQINNGTSPVHYRLGTTSGVAALSSDPRINPGDAWPIARGSNTYIAFLADSGSPNVDTSTGSGQAPVGPMTDWNNPAVSGCRGSTTVPTAASDAATVGARCDKFGNLITSPFGPRDLDQYSGLKTLTDTTETSLLSAGTTGVFNDLLWVKVCNLHASTAADIDVRDATAGTVRDSWHVEAGKCVGFGYPSPFGQTTAANAWTVKEQSTVSSVTVLAKFRQTK